MKKVWMLTHGGEGIPTNIALFREDRPPSTERVKEFLYNFMKYEDETESSRKYHEHQSSLMAESISKTGFWAEPYESAELVLKEVNE
jgi:hypothetical protein